MALAFVIGKPNRACRNPKSIGVLALLRDLVYAAQSS
jgi:hypothetical protein